MSPKDHFTMSSSTTTPPTERKRLPYAVIACDLCRRRKKRCDWRSRDDGHQCSQCLAAGQQCTFTLTQSRTPSPSIMQANAQAFLSASAIPMAVPTTQEAPRVYDAPIALYNITSSSSSFAFDYSASMSTPPSTTESLSFDSVDSTMHMPAPSPSPSPPIYQQQPVTTQYAYQHVPQYRHSTSTSTSYQPRRGYPAPADLLVHINERVADYFSTYFQTMNRGPYFYTDYIDEQAFRSEYDQVYSNIVVSDMSWALCISAVLAVGSRMYGDIEYSEYCAHIATRIALYFVNESLSVNFIYDWTVERRALAYRGLLVIAYYLSAMNESSLVYCYAAQRIISDQQVADMIPRNVGRIAELMPHFVESFKHVSIKGNKQLTQQVQLLLQSQSSAALSSSISSSSMSSQQTMSSSTSASAYSSSSATLSSPSSSSTSSLPSAFDLSSSASNVTSNNNTSINELSLSYRKYLKIKRILCPYLSLSEDDYELKLNKEYDELIDITDELDTSQLKSELGAVNYYLTYAMSTGWDQPLNFDIYRALTILLKAEVVIKGFQRITVYGRKATLYQLLNNKKLAVHAARQTVRCVVCLDTPQSCYPPFSLNFIRAVAILVEWDEEGDEAAILIKGGLHVLRKIAILWNGAQVVLNQLLAHLKQAIDDRERRINECLYDSRRTLERHVLSCLNQELKPELTAAAVLFAKHAHLMEQIQHKRLSVQ